MGFRCGCDVGAWQRLVLTRRHFIEAGASAAAIALAGPGLLHAAAATATVQEATPSPTAVQGTPVTSGDIVINGTSFFNPLVEVYGDVAVGDRCYVADNTILLANEGRSVRLGHETNCQDNAYLLARGRNMVCGNMVSIAHRAVVEDSVIGDFTFLGFRSRTHNATVEEGAMVMHQATVEGVTIRANRIVPVGARILSQADADALPELEEANVHFKEDVLGVNAEFAEGYIRLFEDLGPNALTDVGPNPITTWNPNQITPTLGSGVRLGELTRIVGDVRLGNESSVGERTALRADEGTPIIVGRRARIQSRVTFHALQGTNVVIGVNAQIGDGNVIHGPVTIGDHFLSEDDCVVFQATVGDNVTLRQGATVAGALTLREGTVVPEQAVILTQEDADALPRP